MADEWVSGLLGGTEATLSARYRPRTYFNQGVHARMHVHRHKQINTVLRWTLGLIVDSDRVKDYRQSKRLLTDCLSL